MKRLADGQARAAYANKLLRQQWIILAPRRPLGPQIAAGLLLPPNLDRKEVAHAA